MLTFILDNWKRAAQAAILGAAIEVAVPSEELSIPQEGEGLALLCGDYPALAPRIMFDNLARVQMTGESNPTWTLTRSDGQVHTYTTQPSEVCWVN